MDSIFSPASTSSSPEFDCFSPSSCHSSEGGDSDFLRTPYTGFSERREPFSSQDANSYHPLSEIRLQDRSSVPKPVTFESSGEHPQSLRFDVQSPDSLMLMPENETKILAGEEDPFAAAFAAAASHDHNNVFTVSPAENQVDVSLGDLHAPHFASISASSKTRETFNRNGRYYSSRFPIGHRLGAAFVDIYELGDELGSGGFGFVLVARHRAQGHEVAVKFIIKDKVPSHAWMEDEVYGRLPTEVMLLSLIDHENIVKCLDLFEDQKYYYLVQELHGSSWIKFKQTVPIEQQEQSTNDLITTLPALSPSGSQESIADSVIITPTHSFEQLDVNDGCGAINPSLLCPPPVCPRPPFRPRFSSRASYDLFECIESTKAKRLTEQQASFILAQVVEAVYYLDGLGIAHRDIKDENIVIDKDFKVKLIDFGSAIISNPDLPRPYYDVFYGTTAYASPEILLKRKHQAHPAEVWTIGVLLSYLLTGMSPFRTEQDTLIGHISLVDTPGSKISAPCLHLMRRCLHPDPRQRANIQEVRDHTWLNGALLRGWKD